jgi:hypothetical protein
LDGKNGLHDSDDEASVYDELWQKRAAFVSETAVPIEQSIEVRKSGNGEIAGKSGLDALFPVNSHSHMSWLNKGYVVATVTDAEDPTCPPLSYQKSHLGLLSRRHSRTDNGRQSHGQLEKFLSDLLQSPAKRCAVDDKNTIDCLLLCHCFPPYSQKSVEIFHTRQELASWFGSLNEEESLVPALNELHGSTDTNRCLNFVASQHPYLHADRA